jgi:hypothetical protein
MVIYVIPIMGFVQLWDVNVDRIQHVDLIVHEVILFERKTKIISRIDFLFERYLWKIGFDLS